MSSGKIGPVLPMPIFPEEIASEEFVVPSCTSWAVLLIGFVTTRFVDIQNLHLLKVLKKSRSSHAHSKRGIDENMNSYDFICFLGIDFFFLRIAFHPGPLPFEIAFQFDNPVFHQADKIDQAIKLVVINFQDRLEMLLCLIDIELGLDRLLADLVRIDNILGLLHGASLGQSEILRISPC